MIEPGTEQYGDPDVREAGPFELWWIAIGLLGPILIIALLAIGFFDK